jgi:Zn-dependent M28 family amino/carboxypeptidase
LPKDRIVSITKKGFSALTDEIAKGGKVMLDINLDQKMVKGPFPVYNVVAEIKGTEKPDEVVIVSGHLDSWDGPGSQGAQDNGTGTMVALEAARLLNVSGAKPKRTIRFIMWTGEEQGLFGSRKYVEQHKAELDKISAVLVDDGGTNYQGGMSAIESMEPMMKAAHGDVDKYFPDMPFKITVGPRIPRGGGSDHASFNAVGVPGFFWFETGKSDYNHVHHTQFDRYETAVPEYLFQSSTNSAYMAYNLACAATMLPREAPPTAPTGR